MAYSYAYVQCMLLFLVLVGNCAWFRILHSYTLLLKSPFICTLADQKKAIGVAFIEVSKYVFNSKQV